MNQQHEIISKSLDALIEATTLVKALAKAQAPGGTHLKSAAGNYSYNYSYAIDLGQGRTRNIHLTFALDPQTGELVLMGETVADSDA